MNNIRMSLSHKNGFRSDGLISRSPGTTETPES